MSKLKIHNELTRDIVIKAIYALNLTKCFIVEIKLFRNTRSNRQNALYWEWLTIIANDLGYFKDDLHDEIREKFLPVEEYEILGVRKKRLTSTAKLDVLEMSNYMRQIEIFFASEYGIVLPVPLDDCPI
jgi:hypothetical protein